LKVLTKAGALTRSGKAVRDPAKKVKGDERFTLAIPAPEPAHNEPQEIPLPIVYEDEHLLVIDKPAGLVVHPAAGNRDGTLVNALLHHCGDSLSGIGGVARPGIVHRIDKTKPMRGLPSSSRPTRSTGATWQSCLECRANPADRWMRRSRGRPPTGRRSPLLRRGKGNAP
jgi:hypothetical protein